MKISAFVVLLCISLSSLSAMPDVPDLFNNSALSDSLAMALESKKEVSQNTFWYPKKLNFINGVPSLESCQKEDYGFLSWIGQFKSEDDKKSAKVKAVQLHALQYEYERSLHFLKTCPQLGCVPEEMMYGLLNQKVLEKQQQVLSEHLLESVDSTNISYQAEVNPSFMRSIIAFSNKHFLGPWRTFYTHNQDTIDSILKGLLIFSAAAFIFNKLGGTEWLKNKIRDLWSKPTVYTVRRRASRLFPSKKQSNVVHEDDLILSPLVRKQVSEIIYLVRRRQELKKLHHKNVSLPLLLLYGPPGTGKSTIAQMIADQSVGDDGRPMNYITLVAADFMQVKDEGDRVAVLKKMFKEARSLKNTVIFLDEIDGMVLQRGEGDERINRAFLDHLLDELARPSADFLFVAATNHIDRVDAALLSRLRRKIEVKLPTLHQRTQMIEQYAKKMLIKQSYQVAFSYGDIAQIMQGSSGRDIESFFMRLKDRLDFIEDHVASAEYAYQILQEMGFLPSLESTEDDDLLDIERSVLGKDE